MVFPILAHGGAFCEVLSYPSNFSSEACAFLSNRRLYIHCIPTFSCSILLFSSHCLRSRLSQPSESPLPYYYVFVPFSQKKKFVTISLSRTLCSSIFNSEPSYLEEYMSPQHQGFTIFAHDVLVILNFFPVVVNVPLLSRLQYLGPIEIFQRS